jgi:hypothetical protein
MPYLAGLFHFSTRDFFAKFTPFLASTLHPISAYLGIPGDALYIQVESEFAKGIPISARRRAASPSVLAVVVMVTWRPRIRSIWP